MFQFQMNDSVTKNCLTNLLLLRNCDITGVPEDVRSMEDLLTLDSNLRDEVIQIKTSLHESIGFHSINSLTVANIKLTELIFCYWTLPAITFLEALLHKIMHDVGDDNDDVNCFILFVQSCTRKDAVVKSNSCSEILRLDVGGLFRAKRGVL